MAYESPIEIIQREATDWFETNVIKACMSVGINVNRDRLIRALQFDRNQYNAGYADGYNASRWIPVKNRLPEEDTDVLISYRYKEGEGDTSHVYIDITSYGDMYFGGRKVEGVKHWRPPFEYFTSNYEVVAWQPIPEPCREEQK